MASPINIRKLLAYSIPSVRQVFSPKDTAFYALSVGLGGDPLDEHQLRFVDPSREQVALPTMALVLGHPGFWLADPESGVDPSCVVHGEQTIEMMGALPVEGEVVSETDIVEVVDKGPGKAALLHTRKKLFDVTSGQLLSVTSSTTFIKEGGGFGGQSNATQGVAPVEPTSTPPDHSITLATRPEQALYYRLNGDDNPLHADPAAARLSGFSTPILHGLCTFGMACHAVVRVLGGYNPHSLRSLTGRFSSPVFPGETLKFDVWNNGSFKVYVVERDVAAITNGHAWFH
ncbi:MaoC/PaaZ C-terminal domain-containing protein [Pseudomonas fluorescens]|uniref:MaoC/PaaZ C-terminal domain-containing protein n=1 Tax=Pseudomonas fluorescens TaxID=294 RepID=UPI00191496DF|nr:MaoC/PaaZ C-terminal domain-containing protein [Pseudomonas fluorescens]